MNFQSLRFRLIWIHSAAIALVVVCIGLVRYQLVSYRSQQRFDEALLRDAALFQSRFNISSSGHDLSIDGLTTANALALQELEHYFILTDSEGRIIHEDLHNRNIRAMFYRGELQPVLRRKGGFTIATASDGSVYRFVSSPIDSPGVPGQATLHLGRSMEPQKAMLGEYLIFYLYSVPLILAISVGAGWFLAARALRPFEEITRTAEKITYENLNMQIVTEHKEEEILRLVQAFNSMVHRLNDSFQQMRKFNADAAHELRTPLAILQGETEVALRSPNLPDEIRSVLASNLEELERLTRIVNDLLTLAEAQAGKQVLVKEAVELKPLLEDLVDQMRLLASDRGISVEVRCKPGLWIDADTLWIRRAVLNLLDNAIKYSREGDTIEIVAVRENQNVNLSIRDHGIGILPDDIPHIFDRLYRADPARSRVSGGVGLGLAIVKWIVEAHNGMVRVESEPDRGTVFEMSFPLPWIG